jgi:replication factor A1
LICEIQESLSRANDVDKSHFFFLNGYVSKIKNDDRLFYPACKNDNCRKKVTEDHGGFRCETCNLTFTDYNPTYMFSACISDLTDSIYISFTREQGTALIGMTAEEFRRFKEKNDESAVQAHFDKLLFKRFNVMVKGKYEYFNGETRMKYFAVKVLPFNVKTENSALLSRLAIFDKMGGRMDEDSAPQDSWMN